MIIRQLDLSDVDQIAKLHIDTESQSYKNVAPEMLNYVSDFEGRKQIWRKSLELGTIAYFGFVDKTSYPIAFVSGRAVYDVSTSSDYALLSGVFVTREHQSYGVHTFDWAARAKPVAMAANCAHPARMVLGPGGL